MERAIHHPFTRRPTLYAAALAALWVPRCSSGAGFYTGGAAV
jgi:hypothetical protein